MSVQKPGKHIRKKAAPDIKTRVDKATVCIVGLGYVGLPLVEAFAKSLKVIGYDIKASRVAELRQKYDNPRIIFKIGRAHV